jgi:hypothetical protein
MSLYYIYLFFWAKLFGTSEFALRAANMPFILLFSFALVWSSWRVFRSRVAWLAAGMLPFIWHYTSEARPYMALLALSAVGLASLIRFISADSSVDVRPFPWICLSCIVVGSLFHMLFLLIAAPMLLIVALTYRAERSDPRWRCWRVPLAVFALPLAALALFFAFTFHQGVIDYNYPAPGARQMFAIAYELAGLSGFGPNRKFSLDFRAYALPIALGGLAIGLGAACAAYPALRRGRRDQSLTLLAAAACLCCVEVVALCVASGKQLDARHLAALVPVFLFLLMALISQAPPRASLASLILLGGAWCTSSLRAQLLPEYQKEDYRDAVRAALSIHQRTGAEIMVAADPVAVAYYGADVRGPAPCYPIQDACAPAFSRVPWPRSVPALDAGRWTKDRVQSWLSSHREPQTPVAVLVRLDRSHRVAAWEPLLTTDQAVSRVQFHGFEIVVLNGSAQEGQFPRASVFPNTVETHLPLK